MIQYRSVTASQPATQPPSHVAVAITLNAKASSLKSAQRRRKHCALAVVRRSQKFSPAADPLPGGAGRLKCNQLEMVTTFTRPTNKQTYNTQTQTQAGPITIHCAAKLSTSVIRCRLKSFTSCAFLVDSLPQIL